MIHLLKTWPDQFEAMARGEKEFENRIDDRDFMVGDILVLREYDPSRVTNSYSGRYLVRIVTYLIRDAEVMIADGWCCMQTRPAPETLLTVEDRMHMKRGD
jgi:hypothetical protein